MTADKQEWDIQRLNACMYPHDIEVLKIGIPQLWHYEKSGLFSVLHTSSPWKLIWLAKRTKGAAAGRQVTEVFSWRFGRPKCHQTSVYSPGDWLKRGLRRTATGNEEHGRRMERVKYVLLKRRPASMQWLTVPRPGP
jgi:hypothetical protein